MTCGSEDAALASLGGQIQAESSVSGVHRSVHDATGPTLLNMFRLLFAALLKAKKAFTMALRRRPSTSIATVHAKVH